MAESLVQIAEGVGKKLHTWSRLIAGNTVEDEVVLLGENYLPTYTMSTGAVGTGTANSHLFQVMSGGSLRVRVRRIRVYQFGVATAAAIDFFQLVRLTTAGTGGGAQTFVPLDTTDPAPGATGMSLPTVKGTEGAVIDQAAVYFIQTIGASMAPNVLMCEWDFDRPRSKPLIIAAGGTNGIALKNVNARAGASVLYSVTIDESSF